MNDAAKKPDPLANLRRMIEKVSGATEPVFNAAGKLYRTYHCFADDGSHFAERAPWLGSKDASTEAVRRMMAEKNVVAYVCVDEGYVLATKGVTPQEKAELMEKGTAARPHERVEVALFVAEDHAGFTIGMRAIIRPPRGKPTLGPLRFPDEGLDGRYVGLMTNVLPKRRLH